MNHIATRTRGCQWSSVGGAVKFLSPGGHQVGTQGCATYAVGVKHICFFPVFETAKQLLWFDELDTALSRVLVIYPPFKVPSFKGRILGSAS